MMQLPARALDQDDLILIPPSAAQCEAVSSVVGFESEILIEFSAERRVGNRQAKMLQRFNGHGPLP
ncbi:MAG: hypothetical protein O3B21_03545 [Proteobacteria bacterium]|nr:hypothetical protein [Pseudomonadota bacterium]MDA1356516.1 hypothetical protein [Pseudomonadota bacterium]